MLPARTGNLQLSEDASQRLGAFYRRFCTGAYGALYGISHMIYACRAAFPLLLSPELANRLWLNFNTYEKDGQRCRMHAVVVSDFLLSPLLRPVGKQQLELIPEIRAYLLFLLKDDRWFRSFGISSVSGAARLEQLAHFLDQYIGQGLADGDQNAPVFKQLNRWAALAYLSPDTLAQEMAQALRDTFTEAGQPDLEQDQLRLNMLINRFGQQMKMAIHQEEQDETMFRNLNRYSVANKARLFKDPAAEVSDLFFQLDETYLEKEDTQGISLPLPAVTAGRLLRKKDKVQRVIPLLVGIDEYPRGELRAAVSNVNRFELALQSMNETDAYAIEKPVVLLDHQATIEAFRIRLDLAFAEAHEEDVVLVYFSGRAVQDESGSALMFYHESPKPDTTVSGVYHHVFKSWIQAYKTKTKCRLVLILDTDVNGYDAFVPDDDIQLAAVSQGQEQREIRSGETSSTAFNQALVALMEGTGGRITYNDLLRILRLKTLQEEDFRQERPVLIANAANRHRFFLSREVRTEPVLQPLMCYEQALEQLLVTGDDFLPPLRNVRTHVLEYPSGAEWLDTTGEIYTDDNQLVFGASRWDSDPGKIYILEPERWPLLCADQTLTGLAAQQLPLDPGPFSLWGRLQDAATTEQTNYGTLTLEDTGEDSVIATVSFRSPYSGDTFVSQWTVPATGFAESFRKFSRYIYLKNLALDTDPRTTDEAFMLQLFYGWQHRNDWQNDDLELDVSSFDLSVGKLKLRPLNIEIHSDETQALYFHLYLLTSAFDIYKLKVTQTVIAPGTQLSMTVDVNDAVQQALSAGATITLKVLFSRDPIHLDFSQRGII